MSQLFNVNGRWLTFEQASKVMAEQRGEVIAEEKKIEEIVETKEPVSFVCLECGKECKSQWHLDKHLNSHKKEEKVEEVIETKEEISNLNKILE